MRPDFQRAHRNSGAASRIFERHPVELEHRERLALCRRKPGQESFDIGWGRGRIARRTLGQVRSQFFPLARAQRRREWSAATLRAIANNQGSSGRPTS